MRYVLLAFAAVLVALSLVNNTSEGRHLKRQMMAHPIDLGEPN